MKDILDKVGIYLPKYLSEESTKVLLRELRDFRKDGTNKLIYTTKLDHEKILFQGDGLKKLPICTLHTKTIKEGPVILLSNTCDMDVNNKRAFPTSMMYAPILNFEKYKELLQRSLSKKDVESHILSLKNQEITQLLYLPQGAGLDYDGIVFLDMTNSISNNFYDREQVQEDRLFTLSDYGLYLFLLKLSIHFTRIQERIDRNDGNCNA